RRLLALGAALRKRSRGRLAGDRVDGVVEAAVRRAIRAGVDRQGRGANDWAGRADAVDAEAERGVRAVAERVEADVPLAPVVVGLGAGAEVEVAIEAVVEVGRGPVAVVPAEVAVTPVELLAELLVIIAEVGPVVPGSGGGAGLRRGLDAA